MQKEIWRYKNKPLTVIKVLIALLAIAVGLYPVLYFVFGPGFGLLGQKDPLLTKEVLYKLLFYAHITGGGLALLIGWPQFIEKLRVKRINLHRNLGKVYVLSALLSSSTGIVIGFFAEGGYIAKTGFIGLGIVWLITTLTAYRSIRRKNIPLHRVMMIYSYAACLAAVTLRIYIPTFMAIFHDFTMVYRVVAWLCWVPNILIAYLYVNRRRALLSSTQPAYK